MASAEYIFEKQKLEPIKYGNVRLLGDIFVVMLIANEQPH